MREPQRQSGRRGRAGRRRLRGTDPLSTPLTDTELALLARRVGPGGTRPSQWLPPLVAEVCRLRKEKAELLAALVQIRDESFVAETERHFDRINATAHAAVEKATA